MLQTQMPSGAWDVLEKGRVDPIEEMLSTGIMVLKMHQGKGSKVTYVGKLG